MAGQFPGRPQGMDFGAPGQWWKNSDLLKEIGVNADQVQKIEKIFQDHQIQLIDFRAALEKQEAILRPLMEADQPDESQVIAQIDKVAQARATLEKSNVEMLFATRRVLTNEQWKKLRDLLRNAPLRAQPGFEPPAGPSRGKKDR
jgi:Spy/CpxP family protein refolding chaperone